MAPTASSPLVFLWIAGGLVSEEQVAAVHLCPDDISAQFRGHGVGLTLFLIRRACGLIGRFPGDKHRRSHLPRVAIGCSVGIARGHVDGDIVEHMRRIPASAGSTTLVLRAGGVTGSPLASSRPAVFASAKLPGVVMSRGRGRTRWTSSCRSAEKAGRLGLPTGETHRCRTIHFAPRPRPARDTCPAAFISDRTFLNSWLLMPGSWPWMSAKVNSPT